jgi:uncharacterized protein
VYEVLMQDVIVKRQKQITELCKRFNVTKLEVFGSAARRMDYIPERSDMDFAVEFGKYRDRPPLEEFLLFRAELSETLGQAIDLVELAAVKNPYILQSIERDKRLVFAA